MPPVLGQKSKSAWGQFQEIFILCKLEKEFKVFISINKKDREQKRPLTTGMRVLVTIFYLISYITGKCHIFTQ